MVSPQARREQVRLVCERGVSQRRACGLLGVPRSTLSYQLRLPAKDAPTLAAMRRLSAQYPRYGARRIRIFLRREGDEMGINRARRLWRQAVLLLVRLCTTNRDRVVRNQHDRAGQNMQTFLLVLDLG